MTVEGITHVGLNVLSVREAESFYVELFQMEVVLRESELADGWATVPHGASWEEIEAAGVDVGLSSLRSGGLRIALQPGNATPGLLTHLGLHVDDGELERVRDRVVRLGCPIVADRPGRLMFEDPYGVGWELATTEEVRSSGEALGRWVELSSGG